MDSAGHYFTARTAQTTRLTAPSDKDDIALVGKTAKTELRKRCNAGQRVVKKTIMDTLFTAQAEEEQQRV